MVATLATIVNEMKADYDAQLRLLRADIAALVALANETKATANALVTLTTEIKSDFNGHTHKGDGSEVGTYNTSGPQSDAATVAVGTAVTIAAAAATAVASADAATTVVAQGAHRDKSETTVTAANATNLATSLTLCNDILGVYQFHMADTLAHKVTGVALASYALVSTLADAITRANDIKSKYETHRASTTYHYTADSTNAIAAADATDQTSLNTLLNELKADLNLHMASGAACGSVRAVDA